MKEKNGLQKADDKQGSFSFRLFVMETEDLGTHKSLHSGISVEILLEVRVSFFFTAICSFQNKQSNISISTSAFLSHLVCWWKWNFQLWFITSNVLTLLNHSRAIITLKKSPHNFSACSGTDLGGNISCRIRRMNLAHFSQEVFNKDKKKPMETLRVYDCNGLQEVSRECVSWLGWSAP